MALLALFFAGCDLKPSETPVQEHSRLWKNISGACPVRKDSVVGIEKACAMVTNANQQLLVFAVTTNDYYLISDPAGDDRRLMKEELFKETLGLSGDELPRLIVLP